MTEPKVAVLVAGPFRYAHLVLRNLEKYLRPIDFDVFFLIWKNDLGNKRREDEAWHIDEVISSLRTKALLIAEPFSESFYAPTIGTETGSNSTINATMGMFYSMSALCSYVDQMPNSHEYTHFLRMRTDCAILSNCFAEKLDFDPAVLTVAKSYDIPNGWISDFITFGVRETFFALWHHLNIESIYQAYRKGHRNPERTLAYLARTRLRKTRVVESLIQRDDFTIVYSKVPEHDPNWIKKAVAEGGKRALFEDSERYRDEVEIAQVSRRGYEHCRKITPSVAKETLKRVNLAQVAVRRLLKGRRSDSTEP